MDVNMVVEEVLQLFRSMAQHHECHPRNRTNT
jgi:hypothetical protein